MMGHLYGNDVYEYAEDVLTHHGIKGQKWGVRHGPPYPLEEKKRYAGTEKNESQDHSKSNKSPLAVYALRVAYDVATLNVVGLPLDVIRGGQAVLASHKEKLSNKRLESITPDKKTGLRKKQREFTEDQDMAEVNPSYRNFDTNTKNNCMLCTTAYEMRRRGFDVRANKASRGYNTEDFKSWFPKAKVEPLLDERKNFKAIVAARHGANNAFARDVISKLSAQGDGARGNLCVSWPLEGTGHSVVYEVKGGSVLLRDCQTNRKYNKPEKFLKRCVEARCIRMDNLEPDYKKLKGVLT